MAGSAALLPADDLRVLWRGRERYEATLAFQRDLQAEVAAGQRDCLVLVEHEPVITLGRRADPRHVLHADAPVVRVSRGGDVTCHGPGQLVGYPILDLSRRGRDVHRYLRDLESMLMGVGMRYGVRTERRVGMTGVWCGEDKLAAIGVGLRRWVTLHGFALNVADMRRAFAAIVPCGLQGTGVTSLEQATGGCPALSEVARVVEEEFRATFGYAVDV